MVLDPGHGGKDHGAVYHRGAVNLREKDLTLRIAKETELFLKSHGVDVRLTRDEDQALELSERTGFANRLRADIFISIHINAMPQGTHALLNAEGPETYILNTATDRTSRRLAHLENTVLKGSPLETQSDGPVSLILRDLILNANLGESKKLACALQREAVRTRFPKKYAQDHYRRGVKQSLFYVLLGADMPSVLFEAGFMNHAKDRDILTSTSKRAEMAHSIGRAVLQYKDYLRGGRQPHLLDDRSCKVN